MDKYSPKSYMELLSDEAINRSVVAWLKSWDTCVFGTATSKGSKRSGGGAFGVKQHGDTRPEQKILLMSGAPGWHPHTSL